MTRPSRTDVALTIASALVEALVLGWYVRRRWFA